MQTRPIVQGAMRAPRWDATKRSLKTSTLGLDDRGTVKAAPPHPRTPTGCVLLNQLQMLQMLQTPSAQMSNLSVLEIIRQTNERTVGGVKRSERTCGERSRSISCSTLHARRRERDEQTKALHKYSRVSVNRAGEGLLLHSGLMGSSEGRNVFPSGRVQSQTLQLGLYLHLDPCTFTTLCPLCTCVPSVRRRRVVLRWHFILGTTLFTVFSCYKTF